MADARPEPRCGGTLRLRLLALRRDVEAHARPSPRQRGGRSDATADLRTECVGGADVGRLPRRASWASSQKPQYGFGAASSLRNAPPTGAVITLTSWAGWPDSFRTMCPRPSSTNP